MEKLISVTDYLLIRLEELGIKDILGVPGDFNLGIVEQIEHDSRFRFISDCNELNASYAADGYARIHGISALITTYGPGELSAVNGIAGAYAERVPVLKITGGIALAKQKQKLPLHHTLLNGSYDQSLKIYEQITCASGAVTFENPGAKIDELIEACYLYRQPVYIQLPQDVAKAMINPPGRKLNLQYPIKADSNILVKRIKEYLDKSNKPVIIVGDLVRSYGLQEIVKRLLINSHIPFVVSWAAKGIIDESLENYAGMYAGEFSLSVIQEFVESSDCILSLGMFNCEINHGEFTSRLDRKYLIDVQSDFISIADKYYDSNFADIITQLKDYNSPAGIREVKHNPHYTIDYSSLPSSQIEHDHLIYLLSEFLQDGDTLILETGTMSFTAGYYKLPENVTVLSSVNWYSIGYALGATTGVSLAKTSGRTILITGDGALQMTAQALSAMLRYGLKPIILVINNDGYTIERAFLGENSSYNDVQAWNYLGLTAVFGGDAHLAKVATPSELKSTLSQINSNSDKMWLVEVMMDKYKCPPALVKLAEIVANATTKLKNG